MARHLVHIEYPDPSYCKGVECENCPACAGEGYCTLSTAHYLTEEEYLDYLRSGGVWGYSNNPRDLAFAFALENGQVI